MSAATEYFLINAVRRIDTISDFDPRDSFSEDDDAEVPMIIEEDFANTFLRDTQFPVTLPQAEIRTLLPIPHELKDNELCALIGPGRVETHLAYVHHFISLQRNLEGGLLFHRPSRNYFFVPNPLDDGLLRVHVMDREPGGRWTVGVSEFGSELLWKHNDQVFVMW
jgi:hypothetical protein